MFTFIFNSFAMIHEIYCDAPQLSVYRRHVECVISISADMYCSLYAYKSKTI